MDAGMIIDHCCSQFTQKIFTTITDTEYDNMDWSLIGGGVLK
jgi:hypothetical protein